MLLRIHKTPQEPVRMFTEQARTETQKHGPQSRAVIQTYASNLSEMKRSKYRDFPDLIRTAPDDDDIANERPE